MVRLGLKIKPIKSSRSDGTQEGSSGDEVRLRTTCIDLSNASLGKKRMGSNVLVSERVWCSDFPPLVFRHFSLLQDLGRSAVEIRVYA